MPRCPEQAPPEAAGSPAPVVRWVARRSCVVRKRAGRRREGGGRGVPQRRRSQEGGGRKPWPGTAARQAPWRRYAPGLTLIIRFGSAILGSSRSSGAHSASHRTHRSRRQTLTPPPSLRSIPRTFPEISTETGGKRGTRYQFASSGDNGARAPPGAPPSGRAELRGAVDGGLVRWISGLEARRPASSAARFRSLSAGRGRL